MLDDENKVKMFFLFWSHKVKGLNQNERTHLLKPWLTNMLGELWINFWLSFTEQRKKSELKQKVALIL